MLTGQQITRLKELYTNGFSANHIARELGISRQSVLYRVKEYGVKPSIRHAGLLRGGSQTAEGVFWLYYNTNRGRPSHRHRGKPRPWVLRIVPGYLRWPFNIGHYKYKKLPEGREYLVSKVEVVKGTAETQYDPHPVWVNKRGDHIRYVRGFLVIDGTVKITP